MDGEIMTKEEIQRYINQCAEDGRTMDETFLRLAEILGITMPQFAESSDNNN